jgi:hypothetical protein
MPPDPSKSERLARRLLSVKPYVKQTMAQEIIDKFGDVLSLIEHQKLERDTQS